MIAYLKGTVKTKSEKTIIIDTGNIGYSVFLPAPILDAVSLNENIELFIHSHIKEDAFDLYGFENQNQLNFFVKLLSVNGIGPKVALEALSTPLDKLKSAIVTEDQTYITKLPGIGKKTAQRLILELKDKIEIDNFTERTRLNLKTKELTEVEDALTGLGYQKAEITKVLDALPEELQTTEEIITYFLKNA